MSFPHNSLPAEFEQDHGTIDLSDELESKQKIIDAYGGEDEDLNLDDVNQRIWLVKIPKFLMEKWSSIESEGKILGKVRVYDEKDVNGDPKIAVILESTESDPNPIIIPIPSTSTTSTSIELDSTPIASTSTSIPILSSLKNKSRLLSNGINNSNSNGGVGGVPNEYKLTLQNTSSKNLFIFGEKEEEVIDSGEVGSRKRRRITSMLGTVNHECSLTPSINSIAGSNSYQTIMRNRLKKASEPKRTIKQLNLDVGTANQLAAGTRLGNFKNTSTTFVKPKLSSSSNPELRTTRMPHNELLDALFKLFESHPYWQLKTLGEHVKQPQVYLKEVLSEICHLLPRGPYVGMWTLKDQFKGEGMAIHVKEKKEESGVGEGGVKKEEGSHGISQQQGVRVQEELDEGDDDDDEDMEEVEIIDM